MIDKSVAKRLVAQITAERDPDDRQTVGVEALTLDELVRFGQACVQQTLNPIETDLAEYQQTVLWAGAERYYCGRMSYAVSDFCNLLIAAWPRLADPARKLIVRDLSEAFQRDDEARERGAEHLPLGNDCDRRQWQRVRQLWAPDL